MCIFPLCGVALKGYLPKLHITYAAHSEDPYDSLTLPSAQVYEPAGHGGKIVDGAQGCLCEPSEEKSMRNEGTYIHSATGPHIGDGSERI